MLGTFERPLAQSVAVSRPCRAGFGDVAERVRAGVAETLGVVGAADAE